MRDLVDDRVTHDLRLSAGDAVMRSIGPRKI